MKTFSILIVEDEAIVALDLKLTLESLNHNVVEIANNVNEALKFAEHYKPDLIFMDINLNDTINGIECYQQIKKSINTNVVYLTAYTDNNTINKAIQTKPLGYITKPFNDEELNSVLELITYKFTQENTPIQNHEKTLLSADYYYDNELEKLFFKEYPIRLSKNENQLLKLLLEAKGNAISYTDIEYCIWPDSAINSETLRALVYRLRGKLEHNFIETVPSYGYKIVY